jgi:uncharacterized lipoprotein YmbA
MPTRHILMLSLVALAGCGASPRYLIEPPAPTVSVRTAAQSIMLRDVSLPDYASADKISVQDADGSVREVKSALWADLPPRAVTLALARQLDTALSATVAAAPWPLAGLPDAEIEVRVERNLAGADGQFRLAGTFYVLSEIGRLGPESSGFDIAVPLAGTSPAQIAAAQSQALAKLAETIARSVGR